MSITIENAEAEALLSGLAAATQRQAPDLLLDLLRREEARVRTESERRIAAGLTADEAMRRRFATDLILDPGAIDEILACDENGLPV